VVRLNYIEAGGFYPLTIQNEQVTEAAFVGTNLQNGKRTTTLVICTKPEANYQYRTVLFDENGSKLTDEIITLGEVKPFAVLRTADVNNLPGMAGYGLPKLKTAIPVLLALDAVWTAFYGDIDTAEKITLINEMLCKFDENGEPITPNEQIKRRFVLLGERLPSQENVIKEIVPEVRVEKFRDAIELLLSMLSMQFGYGLKKYRFEQGQITTATQYAGERQDQLQELNKQRDEARAYIGDIIRAALWFSNTYQGTSWDTDAEITVEFDDSYVVDKESRLLEMRNDILAGIGGLYVTALYLKEKYNLSNAEAMQWAQGGEAEKEEEREKEAEE
jgi:A118 family predicted phage portal protein